MIGLVAIRETRPGTRKRVEKVFCGHASSVDYQRLRRPRWKDGIELGDGPIVPVHADAHLADAEAKRPCDDSMSSFVIGKATALVLLFGHCMGLSVSARRPASVIFMRAISGLCGRMSDAYQLNHLLDRKAMRDQDRFRASIGAGRKQLERAPAAAVGFGTMLAALLGCCGHLDRRPMHRRQGRTVRHELVYFCSEHIENAEASPARAWF